MKQTTLERFVDKRTLADRLGIHPRSLQRLIASHRFPAADLKLSTTCIRWRESTIENWLAENAGEGAR